MNQLTMVSWLCTTESLFSTDSTQIIFATWGLFHSSFECWMHYFKLVYVPKCILWKKLWCIKTLLCNFLGIIVWFSVDVLASSSHLLCISLLLLKIIFASKVMILSTQNQLHANEHSSKFSSIQIRLIYWAFKKKKRKKKFTHS